MLLQDPAEEWGGKEQQGKEGSPEESDEADDAELDLHALGESEDALLRSELIVEDGAEAEVPKVKLFQALRREAVDAEDESRRADPERVKGDKETRRRWE
jgi:hypothetical protein